MKNEQLFYDWDFWSLCCSRSALFTLCLYRVIIAGPKWLKTNVARALLQANATPLWKWNAWMRRRWIGRIIVLTRINSKNVYTIIKKSDRDYSVFIRFKFSFRLFISSDFNDIAFSVQLGAESIARVSVKHRNHFRIVWPFLAISQLNESHTAQTHPFTGWRNQQKSNEWIHCESDLLKRFATLSLWNARCNRSVFSSLSQWRCDPVEIERLATQINRNASNKNNLWTFIIYMIFNYMVAFERISH